MNRPAHRSGTRYHFLDFWRGVACLMVILFHSSYYMSNVGSSGLATNAIYHLNTWMRFGVTIFFVISGYCITAACDMPTTQIGVATRFFLRRYRRIFPLYWVVFFSWCIVMCAISVCGYPHFYSDTIHPMADPSLLSRNQWIGNITLTETWRPLVCSTNENFVLGHAWTLCYEEQFYLVCGLALFFSRKWFFAILAAVTVLVTMMMTITSYYSRLSVEGLFADGHWLIFSAGVWVYYRIHHLGNLYALKTDVVLFGLMCLSLWLRSTMGNQIFGHIAVGLGFAGLLISLHKYDLYLAANPALRPITLCGTMCYSLYLIHWPITKTITHLMAIHDWNTPGITFMLGGFKLLGNI